MPPALATLIDALTAAVRAAPTPGAAVEAVTAVLRRRLGDPGLLDPALFDPGPGGSREVVLHVDPGGGFSLVALVWSDGAQTPPHDHRTWGVVGVHRGAEVETRYALSPDGDRLVEQGSTRGVAGDASGFVPPGDIHRVRHDGDDIAVSLHVYGVDVTRSGSSVRRIYALPEG